MKVAMTEPIINQIHRKAWRAEFKMWDADCKQEHPLKIDMEIDAPTHQRLIEKLKHLKQYGEILRG